MIMAAVHYLQSHPFRNKRKFIIYYLILYANLDKLHLNDCIRRIRSTLSDRINAEPKLKYKFYYY